MIHVVLGFSHLFVVSMGMVSIKTMTYQQGWKGITELKTELPELTAAITETDRLLYVE